MEWVKGNPPSNTLPRSVTEQEFQSAVVQSGYPLQSRVAAKLREAGFDWVHEEWVFHDRDTGELRALDLRASKHLYDWGGDDVNRIRPELNLLVECKRSEYPFVFFGVDQRPPRANMLALAGLHQDKIEIRTDDDLSTWSFSVAHALELDGLPFLTEPPETACTFSKVVRQGSKVSLSGTEAYNGITLPLVKALSDLRARLKPVKTAYYHDLVMPIALAVLDAPMVAVETTGEEPSYRMVPWVRILRHDLDDAADHPFEHDQMHAIDAVHFDWLETYLQVHVLPFADAFAERALRHSEEIASGKAFVSGMGKSSWAGVENRLRPRPVTNAIRRSSRIGWRTLLIPYWLLRRRDP